MEALNALTLNEEPDLFVTPEQLDRELVTLTLLPRSRWQTLLNLETIQVCSHSVELFVERLTYSSLCVSNGTSPKSPPNHQRRRHFFSRPYLGWNIASMSRKWKWSKRISQKLQHDV